MNFGMMSGIKRLYRDFQDKITISKENISFSIRSFIVFAQKFKYALHGRKTVVVHAWVSSNNEEGFERENWGDDLNKYLIEELFDVKVLFIPNSTVKRNPIKSIPKHFLFIGSVITFFNLNNAVICGAGVKNPRDKLIGKPKKVLFVRGPKTRQFLLDHNVECPDIYGDPALLLPLVYQPPQKSDSICNPTLIIHENTPLDNPIVSIFKNQGYKVVSMGTYDVWTDIIDTIVHSTYVVSESLHGLIVSEAYGVPNVWVEITKHFDLWDFKFQDYFESINKINQKSIKLYEEYDEFEIQEKIRQWEKGSIVQDTILDALHRIL